MIAIVLTEGGEKGWTTTDNEDLNLLDVNTWGVFFKEIQLLPVCLNMSGNIYLIMKG